MRTFRITATVMSAVFAMAPQERFGTLMAAGLARTTRIPGQDPHQGGTHWSR
jgi:hypothetical protein